MFSEETICAIATPNGYGGISIIRVSGKNVEEYLDKIFLSKKGISFSNMKGNSIRYGNIVNPNSGEILDEVLVSKMVEPFSYTGENTAEINCHGGLNSSKQIIKLLLSLGVRLAEPGEFTKRAFLNGKIDLVQAQGVSDLIYAKTERASKAALAVLKGELSQVINDIKNDILKLMADLEVTIQYPEYDVPDITNNELLNILEEIKRKIERLLSNFRKGEILMEGFNVVIVGKPNVGKSLLLNSLLCENKAIVTDVAGTTRDVVDEYLNIYGIPIRLYDTAGIRETLDVVEKIGVDRSVEMLNKADLILFMVDASSGLEEEDYRIFKLIPVNKPYIVLLNKTDIKLDIDTKEYFSKSQKILISALEKKGIEEIEEAIYEKASMDETDKLSDYLLSNVRHKNLLEKSLNSINSAINIISEEREIDLASVDINDCLNYLGEITGEVTSEDIIDEIFKNFCLGK